MNRVRLLPIVIMAISALLVLKTVGLMTNGGYILTSVGTAQAAGGGGETAGAKSEEPVSGGGGAVIDEPTMIDQTPTLTDQAPTLGAEASSGETGGNEPPPAENEGTPSAAGVPSEAEAAGGSEPGNVIAAENSCAPRPAVEGEEAGPDGQLMIVPGDCPPLTDAVPQLLTQGGAVPLGTGAATDQALLERLAERRTALDSYEQELTMRASLVEAAEKRIEERQQTLQAIEDQISALVEQRKQMEEGQFAAIVAMYETMKPKDAAKIFDNLDMDVLLRVSKMMNPRKMAPILAEMTTTRAQELTVRMASASADPLDSMTPDDLAALPQIVGQ